MFRIQMISTFAAALFAGTATFADVASNSHGGDEYIAGTGVNETLRAGRDVFAAGNSVTLKGTSGADAHVAGFYVDVESAVGADLYAAGGAVTVRGAVAEDLTAAGFTVRTSQSSVTGGNARLFGGTVTIDGSVDGALTAIGGEVILNAQIAGDAWLVSDAIRFGPDAVVLGQLRYSSEAAIDVPASVASEDRVQFSPLSKFDVMSGFHDGWSQPEFPVLPSFISVFSGLLITLLLMIVVGAIFLTFIPKQVERVRAPIAASPGRTFLVGIIGLAMLFGLVPITALTIIGLPLVPIIILAIILAWSLGYLLGIYAVAIKTLDSFGSQADPSNLVRLLALAAAIVVITALNFIPFVGWVINYTIVLLGLGGITTVLFNRILGNPGLARDVDMKPINK